MPVTKLPLSQRKEIGWLYKDPFVDLILGQSKHWIIFLHPDQSFVGRMYVAIKDWKVFGPNMLSEEQILELYREVYLWAEKFIAENIGQYYHINYAQFGNTWHHLHYHIIPRRTKELFVIEREIRCENIEDINKNYARSSVYRTVYDRNWASELAKHLRKKIR